MPQTRQLFDTLTAKSGLSSEVLANAVDTLQECEKWSGLVRWSCWASSTPCKWRPRSAGT